MYYVSGGKIYSTEKDTDSNKYTELELYLTSAQVVTDTDFALRVKGSGVSSKPANRQLCTMEELIGQFGEAAMDYYDLPSYTVTFDSNGHGTDPESQEVKQGYAPTRPTDPTETGYTFNGWYKEAGTTTAFNFETDTIEADTTLYGKWTANDDTLVYDANGGTGTMEPTAGKVGSNVAVASNTFTYEGYTFSSWNTKADGTGTTYAEGASFKLTPGLDTLYAQWTENAPAEQSEG